MKNPKQNKSYSMTTLVTFLIPSIIGILLFMTPVSYEGNITIPIAILAKGIQALVGDYATLVLTVVVSITGVASLIYKLSKPSFIKSGSFLEQLLSVSLPWLLVRLVGMVFALATYFKLGHEAIYSADTGGLVFGDLMPVLFSVFILAGLLLPLLLNFGLLELFGILLTKVMRPVFNLPGRSAIDSLASWLGDGSVGILLTSKQYEEKYYTQREAAVIGTTFSAVSITFSLVVLAQVNLEHLFVPFYFAICLAGVAAAIIVPRLPPLSNKQDLYIDGSQPQQENEVIPAGYSTVGYGFEMALKRAETVPSLASVAKDGVKNAIDMVFGVLPVVMAIGTTALMIATYTPVFDWLGMPFIPLFELLAIPQPIEAAKTVMVGFSDMFVPSILATSIEADMTRFVIAAMSVTQLIYMSEVGALLLGSKIPVKLWELFVIFILRTLVTLPVVAGVAHLVF
ncbi:YjiH family protein [Paraferrimonas sp. SM1919]|uniref:YjiH family protein n=1 Tax=Paraferrimonas sp. SM1919 TaxID=2662263 RepID=UPI0013D69079|nr:YjiH family protein [Paraferrimonas sp. SM1919]